LTPAEVVVAGVAAAALPAEAAHKKSVRRNISGRSARQDMEADY
jgi:hypothetical protein